MLRVFKKAPNIDGTVDPNVCNLDIGKCLCKPNWIGKKCEYPGNQELSTTDKSYMFKEKPPNLLISFGLKISILKVKRFGQFN